MIKPIDRLNIRINGSRLIPIEIVGHNSRGESIFRCLCDCGNESVVLGGALFNGGIRSCGCIGLEKAKIQAYKMGISNTKYLFCKYCGEPHYAKEMCRNCYDRFRHNGTVEYKRPPKNNKLEL